MKLWTMDSEKRNDYFRVPSLLPLVLVPLGLILLVVAFLQPAHFPYYLLGPGIGNLLHWLVNENPAVLAGIFHFTWIAHIAEAVYSYSVCKKKNISDDATMKWVLQTLIYGVFSLGHLLSYDPKKKK